MDTKPNVYILYGSQTGNAEEISSILFNKCSEELKTINVKYFTLNQFQNNINEVERIASMIIIVCSTTGNGDAPHNACLFWRTIKKRSNPPLFKDVPYCVLGLGDTNYDKFCHMGKSIDTRISSLGGQRILPLACADEATNLEETVDSWIDDVFTLILNYQF